MYQSYQRSNSGAFPLSNGSNQNQQQIKLQNQTQNQAQQQQLLKRQVQPLSVSQMTNIQQQQQLREAQMARDKLNSYKSFSLEDDLEFYPHQIDTRPKLSARGLVHAQMSPYTTPTKINGLSSMSSAHRMNGQLPGYISPHAMDSPQQQNQHLHHSHQQNFNSPQSNMIRRLDLPSYQHSPGRNW